MQGGRSRPPAAAMPQQARKTAADALERVPRLNLLRLNMHATGLQPADIATNVVVCMSGAELSTEITPSCCRCAGCCVLRISAGGARAASLRCAASAVPGTLGH